MQNRLHNFTKLGLGFISLLSLTWLISNHQKIPFRCLIQLHTNFQIVPVCSLPCRPVNRSVFVYRNNTRLLVGSSPNLVLVFTFSCPTHVPNFSLIKACIPELEWFLKRRKKLKLWSIVSQKRQMQFTSN